MHVMQVCVFFGLVGKSHSSVWTRTHNATPACFTIDFVFNAFFF